MPFVTFNYYAGRNKTVPKQFHFIATGLAPSSLAHRHIHTMHFISLIALPLLLSSTIVVAVVSLEKDGIEKDGRSHEKSLLIGSGIRRKRHFKRICVCKDFRGSTLCLFQNLASIRSLAVGILLIVCIDMKGLFATSCSTARISL